MTEKEVRDKITVNVHDFGGRCFEIEAVLNVAYYASLAKSYNNPEVLENVKKDSVEGLLRGIYEDQRQALREPLYRLIRDSFGPINVCDLKDQLLAAALYQRPQLVNQLTEALQGVLPTVPLQPGMSGYEADARARAAIKAANNL